MNTDLVQSSRVCELLEIDRSTLSRWVAAGRLVPVMRLSGRRGALLFSAAEIEVLREKRRLQGRAAVVAAKLADHLGDSAEIPLQELEEICAHAGISVTGISEFRATA